MPSLKIKSGNKVECLRGRVEVVGGCVCFYETPADGSESLIMAYCLFPGEMIRQIAKGEYVVEL